VQCHRKVYRDINSQRLVMLYYSDKCLLADREPRIFKSINLSLKRFRRLAQDTLNRTTASATVSCSSVDSELTVYLADCKNYNKSTGLDFWLSEAAKYPLLAPLAQDLLSAPASQAYAERVFSVRGDLTAGKRNRLTKYLENRAFLKINYKHYAWHTLLHTLLCMLRRN